MGIKVMGDKIHHLDVEIAISIGHRYVYIPMH